MSKSIYSILYPLFDSGLNYFIKCIINSCFKIHVPSCIFNVSIFLLLPNRLVPPIRSRRTWPPICSPIQLHYRPATLHLTSKARRMHLKHKPIIKQTWMETLHAFDGCFADDVEIGQVVEFSDFWVLRMF